MKELEDYNWFPPLLRNFQTDYIGFVVANFNIYSTFINYLNMQVDRKTVMFDLCSGSGEPAVTIFTESKNYTTLRLSDKYPNLNFSKQANIFYIDESIDVLNFKFEEGVTYTMYNAFHHFSDADKKNIIQKCNAANANMYIVEILEPTFLFLVKVLMLTTIGVLLFSPFIKPFSWQRLFFTYIIPINIITISFDGIISVLKSRSFNAYKKLYSGVNNINVLNLKKGISSLLVIELVQKS
jgi:hypothetical protein